MATEEKNEDHPNFSLQFHCGQSLTDGEMEELMERNFNS